MHVQVNYTYILQYHSYVPGTSSTHITLWSVCTSQKMRTIIVHLFMRAHMLNLIPSVIYMLNVYPKTLRCIYLIITYKTTHYDIVTIAASQWLFFVCLQFVHPLPREEGYELMFSQFSGHRCHFTSLINYKQYQENAPICLTLTHYVDLQDSKGAMTQHLIKVVFVHNYWGYQCFTYKHFNIFMTVILLTFPGIVLMAGEVDTSSLVRLVPSTKL